MNEASGLVCCRRSHASAHFVRVKPCYCRVPAAWPLILFIRLFWCAAAATSRQHMSQPFLHRLAYACLYAYAVLSLLFFLMHTAICSMHIAFFLAPHCCFLSAVCVSLIFLCVLLIAVHTYFLFSSLLSSLHHPFTAAPLHCLSLLLYLCSSRKQVMQAPR